MDIAKCGRAFETREFSKRTQIVWNEKKRCHEPETFSHYPLYPDEIGSGERRKGVWTWDDETKDKARPDIYVTCPHCAKIMNAADHEINEEGFIFPCIVCPSCKCHVFYRLMGWSGVKRDLVWNEEDERRERLRQLRRAQGHRED